MMSKSSFAIILALVLVGCDDGGDAVDSGAGADAALPDAGNDAGPGTDAGPRMGEVTIAFAGTSGIVLAGVTACLTGTSTCATSGVLGTATLTLPLGIEASLEVDAPDTYPQMMAFRDLSLADGTTFGIFSTTSVEELFDSAGVTADPALGHVLLAFPSGEGATIAISAGEGPFYGEGRDFLVDPSLTAVPAGFALALIANLPVGEQMLTISVPTGQCTGNFGWSGSEPNIRRFPVTAGRIAADTISCL